MTVTINGTTGITSPGGDSNASLTSSGNDTAAAFIPSGSSAPTNGLYLPATNTPAISSNSTKVVSVIKGSSLALEGATPQTGTGISFPAAQVASSDVNTLDDYETGTWTPSVGGNATYNGRNGTYVKIGRLVLIRCYIDINVIGTGSASIISGLPFASLTVDTPFSMSNSYFANLATNTVYLVPYVTSNATTIQFRGNNASGATFSTNALTAFGNSTRIDFSGCYYASA